MAKRGKPTKAATKSNAFLEAITFVGSVLKDTGTPSETHIYLKNNWAVAFNGILAAGTPIENDISACPNYFLFQQAVAKCGADLTIAQLDNKLTVKSEKFKATIPCIDPELINIGGYDEATISVNDEFKKALEIVAPLVNENGQHIYNVSILLNGQSVISTENGSVILEAWHGNDLPTNLSIPKSVVEPLAKTTKKLVGFGYSDFSITFHFEDKSFIKTQLFKEQWPDVARILNADSKPFETPKELFEGVAAITSFSNDGLCYFDTDVIRSHKDENIGASYNVSGLPRGPIFSIKQLNVLKEHMKMIDFFCHGPNGPMTMFYGDKVRGVIAGRTQ